MVRGGGRGRRGGRSSNHGAPDTLQSTTNTKCATCDRGVEDDGIGCDRCGSWFHPNSLCTGLPEQVVKTISDFGGSGVAFVCTDCRSGDTDSRGNICSTAFQQLNQTVKMLSKLVASLSEKVEGMTIAAANFGSQPNQNNSDSQTLPVAQSDSLRVIIREEVREMAEREKRKSSLILKGIKVSSNDAAIHTFKDVSKKIIGVEVVPDSVKAVPNTQDMFRFTVLDDDTRSKLLTSAKKMRNFPEYNNVYLNRDLTYMQRKDLRERRLARNRENPNSQTAERQPQG